VIGRGRSSDIPDLTFKLLNVDDRSFHCNANVSSKKIKLNSLINSLERYCCTIVLMSEEDPVSFDGDHRRTVCERLQPQGLTGFGDLNIMCIGASGESRFAFTTWEVAVGQNQYKRLIVCTFQKIRLTEGEGHAGSWSVGREDSWRLRKGGAFQTLSS
jgi:hypothetical protein